MARKKGLREWVKERWVDIGSPKKNGKFQPCGRAKGSGRKYPKCVPIAKANTGPTPSRAATFAKRKKARLGGYIGPAMNSEYGGKILDNPSYRKYYKGMI